MKRLVMQCRLRWIYFNEIKIRDGNLNLRNIQRKFKNTYPYIETTEKINDQIERLSNGLNIMNSTTEKVDALQELLKVKMVEVEIEVEATGKLIA